MHHTHTLIRTQHYASAIGYLKPLLTALVFTATSLCHSTSASEPELTTIEVINGRSLILSDASTRIEAVQLDATMDVSVSGLLAQITLTQTFRNTRDEWMQARYLFPLPETAAVQALMIRTGDRTIHGRIMERDNARKTYESANETGQITGLIEQQRPNIHLAHCRLADRYGWSSGPVQSIPDGYQIAPLYCRHEIFITDNTNSGKKRSYRG